MVVGFARGLAALSGADDEAGLQQERLDHVFESVTLLAHGGGQCFDARRASLVDFDERGEKRPVEFVQAERVDLLDLQGLVHGAL